MLDIPFGAVWLLDAMAIRYQVLFIDADDVRAFAGTVREFAKRVAETNDEGAKVVSDLGATWEGASYQGLVSAWSRMSANMPELHEACEFVASALDVAAVVIEVTQAAVIAELAALGAAFVGSMIASAATFGVSAAVSLAVRASANRLIWAMEQVLVAYLINKVLEQAIVPLEHLVERMLNGYGGQALVDDLGPNNVFRMEPEELDRAANAFDHLADQMHDHGAWLSEQLNGLFPGGDDIADPDGGISMAPADGSMPLHVGDPVPMWSDGSDLDLSSAPPYQPAAAHAEAGAQAPSIPAAPGDHAPQAGIPNDRPELRDEQDVASRSGASPDPSATPLWPTDTPWLRPDEVASAAEPSASVAEDRTTAVVDAAAQQDYAAVPTSPEDALTPWAPAGQVPAPRFDAGHTAAPPGRPNPPVSRFARRRKRSRTPWTRDAKQVVAAQQDSAKSIAPDTTATPWRADAPKISAKRKPDSNNAAADTTAEPDNASADPKTRYGAPRAAVLEPHVQERAGT